MSDNKEHIEWLTQLEDDRSFSDSNFQAGEQAKAIEAAIRALKFEDAAKAKAKDDAEEKMHCHHAACALLDGGISIGDLTGGLLFQRALARAEVEAKYTRLVDDVRVVIHTFNTFDTYRQEEMRSLRRSLAELEGK